MIAGCAGALAVFAAGAARADDAVEAHALSAQGVAGEIMDTAVEHCRRGESEQALSMLAAIREQLSPPPGILRLVQDLEATGCRPSRVAAPGQLRVQAGGGWDSNVSQGITARTLVLGSGDNVLDLELDASYRPRSSAFATAAIDFSMPLPWGGIGLQAAAGARKNFQAPAFDLATGSLAATREAQLGPGTLRAQVDVADVFLGGRHYQRAQGASAQYLVPGAGGAWLGSLSVARSAYLTQRSQDSVQWEAGVVREQRFGADLALQGGVALQRDNATGLRPGGDRTGWQLQAGATWLAAGWRFRPQVTYTRWTSEDVFAVGLIDAKRRNRLAQGLLQAERPLDATTSLLVEWRGRWSRDTVALYQYQARVISATLARRF